MKINEYQKILCATYASGEYAHVTSAKEAGRQGDTLFHFLFLELDDCQSPDEVMQRLDTALGQIEEVAEAMRRARQGDTPTSPTPAASAPRLRDAARAEYGSAEIVIDPDALVDASPDNGAWVAARVWVSKDD